MSLPQEAADWIIPLSNSDMTLAEAVSTMKPFALDQERVPKIIQIVENPKFDIPFIDIFHGAVNLKTHDYIHILLGRGVMSKDEAFVIGFTMGSTNRVNAVEEKLYEFFARHLYPSNYQFDDEDFQIYKDAIRLAYISDCNPLDKVDYTQYLNMPVGEIRKRLGIETDLLKAYYQIEANRYPNAKESQRLL